jgi:hypothetical protein
MRLLAIAVLCWFIFQSLPFTSLLVFYAMASAGYLASDHFLQHFCSGRGGVVNFIFLDSVNAEFINLICLALMFILLPATIIIPFFDMIPIITLIGAALTCMLNQSIKK